MLVGARTVFRRGPWPCYTARAGSAWSVYRPLGGGTPIPRTVYSMASVFVSFDWDHDRRYKFLLEARNKNPRFQFVFSDETPGENDTNNVGRIKAGLTAKIKAATHTLVIVGEYA